MRLIEVSANQESFKTVTFHPKGLNFIVAKQKDVQDKSVERTYNGVGKSLLIDIIHFCLGAQTKRYQSFCDKLPNWEFTLKFENEGHVYEALRKTSHPNQIFLNQEKYSVTKFNEVMKKLCFQIPEGTSTLSFRSLLPFFIRPNKESYASFDSAFTHPNGYQKMLNHAFLLGLDISLAEEKYTIRKAKERIQKIEKSFEQDEVLHDFFTGQKDVTLTLEELDEQIRQMEENLRNFKVAEDYYEVQCQADQVESTLFQLNNQILLLQNQLQTVENGLKIEPSDESAKHIQTIYEEVNVHFSEALQKKLSDLESFYRDIIVNRKRRLSEQRNTLYLKIEKKKEKSKALQRELDDLMGYLGEHEALDVFLTVNEKVNEMKTKRHDLTKYQNLQSEYKEKRRALEKSQIEQSELTDQYLTSIQNEIAEIRNYFRELVKNFYPNSVAGLTIKNNDGDNQLRYEIDAKIESDHSDGINNVKIFCYDLTLLYRGHRHNIDFIFHDSRLFDGIDERQKAQMMKVLYESFTGTDKQYIASINQNQLMEMKSILGEELYVKIIEDHTILTLTDEDETGKLLGIQVDLED